MTASIINIITLFILFYPAIMVIIWIIGSFFYKFRYKKAELVENERKFIILCSVFNEEENIIENINANLDLDYTNYELWMVDDFSTDATAEKISSIQNNKYKYFLEPKNSGKANVLNKYIQLINDDYFIVIDSDTKLEKNSLKYLNAEISKDGEKYSAYTGRIKIDKKGSLVKRIQRVEYRLIINTIKKSQQFFFDSILTVSGAFTCFYTPLIKEIGFNPDVATEDIEFSWKLNTKKYKIKYLDYTSATILTPDAIVPLINQRKRWTLGLLQAINHTQLKSLSPRIIFFLIEIFFSSLWGYVFLLYNLVLVYFLLNPSIYNLHITSIIIPTLIIMFISIITHIYLSIKDREFPNIIHIMIYILFYFWIQPISFVLGTLDLFINNTKGKWRLKESIIKKYILENFLDYYGSILLPIISIEVFHYFVEVDLNILIMVYVVYLVIYYSTNFFYTKEINPLKKVSLFVSILLIVENTFFYNLSNLYLENKIVLVTIFLSIIYFFIWIFIFYFKSKKDIIKKD